MRFTARMPEGLSPGFDVRKPFPVRWGVGGPVIGEVVDFTVDHEGISLVL